MQPWECTRDSHFPGRFSRDAWDMLLIRLQLLRAMKCDTIQGYYISRPVPASEIDKIIANRQQNST